MKLLHTGIKGLDRHLGGGFIKPSTIYLVGEPGAGKTTLATQFLCEGAKSGDHGIYFTTIGEKPIFAHTYLETFKFFDYSYFEKGIIRTIDLSEILSKGTAKAALAEMVKNVQMYTPSRVVIDPITPLALLEKDEAEYRRMLFDFFMQTKLWDCTTLMIGESFSRSGREIQVEEYLADTVMFLSIKEELGQLNRYIKILKVRGNAHSSEVIQFQISKNGIRIVKQKRPTEVDVLRGIAAYLNRIQQ